jgi:hypothetical protein
MRKNLALSLLLACGGCPKGEPCDPATYERGCEDDQTIAYCSSKTHTGRKKVFPTVTRIECQSDTVCIESGEIATCVAGPPAETCDTADATRCVNGLRQKCWDVDATTRRSGVLYWYATGLSCDGTEATP